MKKSLNHLKKALKLTRLLDGQKFGLHAGFFVDRPVNEIGQRFGKSEIYDKKKALKRFIDGFQVLKKKFSAIDLYIENNCYSESNGQVYGSEIPFMLLKFDDYKELQNEIDFNLLLDIGHLMVSANTCGFDFNNELQAMFDSSDYIHISNNDTKHDQNLGLTDKSRLFKSLNSCNWKNKTISLEIYEGMEALKNTYSIVSSLLK